MKSLYLDVNPTDIAAIMTRLYSLIQNRDFGWEFFGLLLAAANWVNDRLKPDKPVIGSAPESQAAGAHSAALDIITELGEGRQVPAEGPLSDRIILMAVQILITKLLANGDLPQWLIDLLNSLKPKTE